MLCGYNLAGATPKKTHALGPAVQPRARQVIGFVKEKNVSRLRRLLAAASLLLLCAALPATPAESRRRERRPEEQPPAPTYRVFATREGLVGHRTANGHRIRPRDRFVALPCWCALASKGGDEFQVRVTYKGRSAVLPVWDVGPWNTRDDYWSPTRRYGDLPIGVPMAQAAAQDGYNRGRDERGRRVRLPNGIDIADGAFWDDLGMSKSDWVEVTFLWLGADPGPGEAQEPLPAPAQPAPDPPPPAPPPPVPAPPPPAPVEPGGVLVDDGGEGYSGEATIKWYDASCGTNGRHAWTYGTPDPAQSENRARWSARLPSDGFYEALAHIPDCGKPATSAARYRVVLNSGAREVTVDQAGSAGKWVSLGIYHVGDPSVAVELTDVTGDAGLAVRFDAVKWLPRADSAPPDARVIEAARQADGGILVRWAGADDVSGVASYDVQARKLPDGGWADWQIGATVGEAIFVPPEPGGYAFRARARDWVGHEQPWRDSDDIRVES